MRDANREYDRRMREVKKPTQSPINFAFTTNYKGGKMLDMKTTIRATNMGPSRH